MRRLQPLPLRNVQIDDNYWNRYTRLIPDVVLPYQWEILNDRVPDAPASHCLHNFRIAAGEAEGQWMGAVFQDTDAYKWLEAVAYSLATRPNAQLEKTADKVIGLIGRAQAADGYLNTYYTLVEPEGRWGNLVEGHELYCAGHLTEAAVAYHEVTGKRTLLDIACRFADLIGQVFGPGEDQLHGYPGHPELELALVRLYHATGKEAYLELARYFVDVRGGTPNYFLQEIARPGFEHIHGHDEFKDYDPACSQSHLPVRQQHTAEGHAVRAAYLYCAMADLAEHYGDETLMKCCEDLWDNMVSKRMYITGGIGSSGFLERFTTDFDLPNDSNYSETCASIGLALFGLRMARIKRDAAYIDTVERALYNTVRAGIALTGDRYFYVNPLEVWPDICMAHTSRAHVKPVRQKWFDVACCPTNIARTLTSLGQYIYSAEPDALYVNLFVQNTATAELGGRPVQLRLATDYPKTGAIRLSVKADNAPFTLHLRLPDFAEEPALLVNGEALPATAEKGFIAIRRVWNEDEVVFTFGIKAKLAHASPLVRVNTGKVAIVRGPEVYCFEEVDNGNLLSALCIENTALEEAWDDELLGGVTVVRCKGSVMVPTQTKNSFSYEKNWLRQPKKLTAVPYGLWNNRQAGEMIVWVRAEAGLGEKEEKQSGTRLDD